MEPADYRGERCDIARREEGVRNISSIARTAAFGSTAQRLDHHRS
jgi:hypothetical protein